MPVCTRDPPWPGARNCSASETTPTARSCGVMASVRWVFNVAAWTPSRFEWSAATRSVQPEEKERIGRFHFRRDARASLAGRLMLRRLLCRHAALPWAALRLGRTDKGKPYLLSAPDGPGVCFNVSHQGRYTVLAAEPAAPGAALGCDVTRAARRPGAPPPEQFFATMRRQFTPDEWTFIAGPGTERQQLVRFHRCWALKESFVKAEGVGIGFSLQRISFACRPAELRPGRAAAGTRVRVDGALDARYRFEEWLLDDEHLVAVAIRAGEDGGVETAPPPPPPPPPFVELTAEELMDEAEFLTEEDEAYCDRYMASEEKNDGL